MLSEIMASLNDYARVVCVDLTTSKSTLMSSGLFDDYGAIYGQSTDIAQRNYEYVFVTLTVDDKIAVVGKSSFWENTLENGMIDPREQDNLGDVFRPFSRQNTNPTARAIVTHYGLDAHADVNLLLPRAIIIPIDVSDCNTSELKGHQLTPADKRTHEQEYRIGERLRERFGILNEQSHRY